MSYPGNASLSGAVKERVLSTFAQALALYRQGRTEEVAAGCNLILQMDPMFEPAKKLQEKLKNAALAIDPENLMPEDDGSPMAQARKAMEERDFQRVIRLTSEILRDDLLNDDARVLGDDAREKIEAAPFVAQFAKRCNSLLASGDIPAARTELGRIKSLDSGHPEVQRIAKAIAAAESAPPTPRPSAPQAPSQAPSQARPQVPPTPPAAPPPSSSFVIDTPAGPPAATGRSAAQAADFGFSFEEETPSDTSFANFSFDTPSDSFSFNEPPPAAPPAPSPGARPSNAPAQSVPIPTPSEGGTGTEFDFATASVSVSPEDQKKIEQYLSEGDRAFDAGDYQQAIDLWSRIFLIDVTNDQASERIERAKAKRQEIERQIDTTLASGITAFERGDTAKAHTDLSEVLRLDPNNSTAKEYLDRLGETVKETKTPAAAPGSNPYVPPSVADANFDFGIFDDDAHGGSLESPLIPPDPGAAPAGKTSARLSAKPSAKRSKGEGLPVLPVAAAVALLALAGGGWFYWTHVREQPDAAAPQLSSQDIGRARTLAGAGKYDQAIALLQDIKPSDPAHDEALLMIADLQQKKSTAAQTVDGMPASQYFDDHVNAARKALDGHDFSSAKAELEKAMRAGPLPPDLKAQYDSISQQVGKLDAARALFGERKYADAIANLQQLLEQDPENQNIRRMITDAHFNLGAVALQEERIPDAIRELDEVLKAHPDDEIARRSRELAVRYQGQPKDLLYRIYVKYLPLRQAS